MNQEPCYLSERSLVEDFLIRIDAPRSPLRCESYAVEFDYSSGRTDMVAVSGEELHAFEAKLTKWKQALQQARRSTCYAHYCYVVLPGRSAKAALRAKEEFVKRGIGLLILYGDGAKLEIPPERNEPLLPWLSDAARRHISKEENK